MNCSVNVINRIKRTQGQINGVLKMIDEQRGCDDLTTQLKAIESSIRKVITLLTIENLSNTIKEKYNINIEEFEKELNLLINR